MGDIEKAMEGMGEVFISKDFYLAEVGAVPWKEIVNIEQAKLGFIWNILFFFGFAVCTGPASVHTCALGELAKW